MAPREFSIPSYLQDRFNEHKVVPFVGAGLSMSVHLRESGKALFPSWKALLQKAVESLKDAIKGNDAAYVDAGLNLDDPDFLAMAQHARSALGGAV